MKRLIEEYTHTGIGYNPFLIRNNWQVAQLNYIQVQGINDIQKIDVHFETDEVFILIDGKAMLIAAEKEGDQVSFEIILMEQGVVYNIPKNVWHNIAMFEDARIIIVEKDNTHLGDYDYYYLQEEQKEKLNQQIASVLKNDGNIQDASNK